MPDIIKELSPTALIGEERVKEERVDYAIRIAAPNTSTLPTKADMLDFCSFALLEELIGHMENGKQVTLLGKPAAP